MNPTASSVRRRVPWIGWLGVAALALSVAVSLVGAGWGRNAKPEATGAAGPETPTPSASLRAACFGFVDVESGVTALYPVQPGRVAEVLVKEGAAVEAGKPLFRMDDRLAKLQVREAQAALAAAEARLAQARILPSQHRHKVEAQRAAVVAAQRDLDAAKGQYAKAKRFLENKIGGSAEDVQAAEAQVRKAEANIKGQEEQLAALNALDPKLGETLAEQDVEAKKVDVEKAELALQECTVVAPLKGIVLRLSVSVGDPLAATAQKQALVFCPDAPRIVRAELEQEFAGRVAIGQTAIIQDDATASGNWNGKVVRLSDWYTHRRSILLEPLQYNDVRTMEAIIQLAPGQAPLRIGQRVRVTLGNVG